MGVDDHGRPAPRARILALAGALLACVACTPVLAQMAGAEAAAVVVKLSGRVTATSFAGAVRELAEDDEVFVGDTIETGAGRVVYVRLRFRDDTTFSLGRSSRMEVSAFVYGDSAQADRIGTRVLRGVFRFVSGLIARRRPRAMGVVLPVATIGIRGTTVGGEVEGDRATVVLLEPETPDEAPTAIEVSNEHGSVLIDEEGFGTEIPDANSPPSAPRRMRLQTIDNLMRSLQVLRRVTVPRPRPRIR